MDKPTIGHYASHQRDVTAQEDAALNAALRSSTVKVEHPEIARLRAELARAKSCACADCNTEILQLRAENEATRRIANQLVGALHLALPLSDSTEILLTHAYHRVQEMQYMIRQLAALAAKGE